MTEPNSLQAGQKFGNGRFVLVRFLGRGGMGEVWRAQDERLHESVALKFLPSEIRGDPVALDDMRRETARSHKLTHANIVRIHDLHEDADGTAFILMEYVDGPTLAALRLQHPNRVFAWDFLRPLLEQLCAALEYAHGEKVIHRDLKPANIMVDGNGRLKLADFGIAAVASDSMSRVSAQRTTSGTLPYMSPQQLTGKRAQTTDDIYALGATLYELLTSQPPFYTGDLTHQILHEPPEPMEERLAALEIQNAIPPDAAALVMACLAKEPGQRPQSALAVAGWIGLEVARKPSLEALSQDVFSETPSEAEPSVTPEFEAAAPTASDSSKKSLLAVGVFAVLLILAAGGWYWKTRPPQTKPPVVTPEVATSNVSVTPTLPQPAVLPEIHEPPASTPAAVEAGFVSLFNGHDLSGWDGETGFWSVEDNAIKGQSPEGNSSAVHNTYLIWTGGNVNDFELRFSFKMAYGDTGSGVLYRGRRIPDWVAYGYQAEFWPVTTGLSGLLAFEAPQSGSRPGFSMLASPGEKVVWGADGKKRVIGATEKSADEIQAAIKEGEWNDYVIIANGNHLVHQINGNITMEATDNDVQHRFMSGVLGLKLRHNKGNPMLVYFKNIRLKRLTRATAVSSSHTSTSLAWIRLFDGRTLSGWTAPDGGDWKVRADGSILSQGPTSHLYSPGSYRNLEFKAEIKLEADASGGLGFRENMLEKNLPSGYMAKLRIADAHALTGGLFEVNKNGKMALLVQIPDQIMKPGAWFVEDITAIGTQIEIKVNDRVVAEYEDRNSQLVSGRLTLLQWKPDATVTYRDAMVKPLPNDEAAAWVEARKDVPDFAP